MTTRKQCSKWSIRSIFKIEKKFVMEQKLLKKKHIELILINQFI